MNRHGRFLGTLLALLCLAAAACGTQEPGDQPPGSPSPGASPSPTADPGVLGEGVTRTGGIPWRLVLQPGEPVCVQLRRLDDVGDFLVCDEDSEQDFNGDERLRYAFGGLNPDQVPKMVIGITARDVARVVVNLAEGESPEVQTVQSSQAPDHRFFVVELDPDPPQEVEAVRGLDASGRTVAGFALGPPEEGPSPLPTGSP